MNKDIKITLADIADITMGQSPKGEYTNNNRAGMPLLNGPTEFGEFHPYPVQYTTDSRKEAMPGSILFCVRGSTTGRMNWADQEYSIGRGLASISHKDDEALNSYIKGILDYKLPELLKSVTGSTFPNVSKSQLFDLEIPNFSISTQKRIADILSALDDKIENNRRTAQTLEQIAQTIFKEKFSKKKLNGPKLGKYITPIRGKNLTKAQAIEGPYPVIAGGLQPSCYHNEYNTKSPVITISASGANAGYIQLHFNPVWSSDSSYIDTDVTQYIYFFYTFLKINQAVVFGKQEGSAQPHIYPSHIEEIIIGDFDENEIQLFEKLISPFYELIKNKIIENEKLEQLRDTLLPKLMSGEIEV